MLKGNYNKYYGISILKKYFINYYLLLNMLLKYYKAGWPRNISKRNSENFFKNIFFIFYFKKNPEIYKKKNR